MKKMLFFFATFLTFVALLKTMGEFFAEDGWVLGIMYIALIVLDAIAVIKVIKHFDKVEINLPPKSK